uniref:Uncharacterized protein n=1 Tax=Panagrolaimus sp. PS1159 TaxID=55785 RepID=A0AC35F8G8_9BILA
MHKKKPSPTAASPVDTTRSLMLPTICLPVQSNPSDDTHSFYGVPGGKDVFPMKGKPKDAKSKHAPTSAPPLLSTPKDAQSKHANKATTSAPPLLPKPKDEKSKHVEKAPTSAPPLLSTPKDAEKKSNKA